MKFSIFTTCETAHGRENIGRDYQQVLDLAEHAEQLGFHAIWLGQHHGSRYGAIPSLPIMAASIAQRTRRVRIGIGIAILPLTHPVRAAEEYAMVDQLSHGRIEFGVGRGYQPHEYRMFGVDQTQSRSILNESIAIVRGLWENERFSYQGRHFQFENVQLFPQPLQHPVPLWIASSSPSSAREAASNGIPILIALGTNPREELKATTASAARALIGRGFSPSAIDFPAMSIAHVAKTREDAYETMRPAFETYLSHVAHLLPGADGNPIPAGYEELHARQAKQDFSKITLESMVDTGRMIVGSPEDVCNQIEVLRKDCGTQQMLCWMRVGGMPHSKVLDSMRLWAQEVVPQFASDAAPPLSWISPDGAVESVAQKAH